MRLAPSMRVRQSAAGLRSRTAPQKKKGPIARALWGNGAAEAAGLAFRQDLMLRTPNTIDAHRLIWFAGRQDRPDRQDAAMEAVFRAYFIQGRDIGDPEVLADCAAEAGLDRAAVLSFLGTDLADAEMRAADQAAREAGVNGVPSFFLDGYSLFSGAMPAETIAEALRRGHDVLQKRQVAAE